MQSSRYAPTSVLNRYLTRQFFAMFLPIIAGFVVLYLLVDVFDRLNVLLRHHASFAAAVRYFAFKIPLIVTQIAPAAVVTSIILSLGLLARHNEITALRSSGVSLPQSAVPLALLAAAISVAVLGWNETIVPYCARKFEYVNNVEIRKRASRGILSDREIWYHGRDGFYNIAYIDKGRRTIHGLVMYRLDAGFHLRSIVRLRRAQWHGESWTIDGATEILLGEAGRHARPVKLQKVRIPETFKDFLEVRRKPEELSFTELDTWIARLTAKGIDASRYLVDLQLKLSVPFASLILGLCGIPIAGRVRRHPSLAAILGTGVALGFAYWVVLALGTSLGHSGALPPMVAAWSANAIFALVGIALFLYSE